jgi:hypothetical protein
MTAAGPEAYSSTNTRDQAGGLGLVLGIRRIRGDGQLPPLFAFHTLDLPGGQFDDLVTVLHRDCRVSLHVEAPRRPRHETPTATDLVERMFTRTQPNRLWVTDITEHRTREGKVYCDLGSPSSLCAALQIRRV